jgi:NADPH:quinone reductase-like Zn-dependent oxidoreductase
MSRTVTFGKAGGPEVLDYVEVEAPNPGANEIRIRVKAIGLNRAESMWRLDEYVEPVARFPAVLGYEAAGIIDALGEGVTGFAVGDAVNVIPSFSMSQIRHLRRSRPCAASCGGEAACIAVLHRGRVDLDDVRDGVRRAH